MEVPGDVIHEREQYIKSMAKFVEEKQQKLNAVLKTLGLSVEELLKREDKKVCPYNKDHVIPVKFFNKHTERCKYLSAGYQEDELDSLLQDVDFCYKDAKAIMKIVIDEKLLNKIIWDSSVQNGQVYTGHRSMPVSSMDENIMLTQDDRLAVYNYVVKTSHEAGKVIPVDRTDELLTTDWGSLVKKGLLDQQNNKQYSSKLEQLAALRDLKRRRQSYRAKNVHITKKSYTEIIREVILNQMEILVPAGSNVNEEDNMDVPRSTDKYEQKGRDRWKDDETEVRKREKDDDRRSEERSRRVQSERHKQRDRSSERYRKRKKSRSRDQSSESKKAKIKEEDVSFLSGTHKPQVLIEGEATQLIEIIKSETDTETVHLDTSTDRSGYTEATMSAAASSVGRSEESLKKNLSSESDSSTSSKKHGKHKKSKHKKKHRKKHKRKE